MVPKVLSYRHIFVFRVKDVVAGMDKARGTRGIREVSDEHYSHTLQQKFSQTVGVTPDWARLHPPGSQQDAEDEELIKVGVSGRWVLIRKMMNQTSYVVLVLDIMTSTQLRVIMFCCKLSLLIIIFMIFVFFHFSQTI